MILRCGEKRFVDPDLNYRVKNYRQTRSTGMEDGSTLMKLADGII